ncbi:complex I NDUFA9 subunit family protein [Amorphus sp. 3PC139-8]|uniref:complex I NDUFA9 subunit family protein n=1 Tax=Amorphus sp. 3PC139-8 TaxID=2735676 RepID=UPI00345DDAB6
MPGSPADEPVATIFGATGFLGRRIVSRALERGWHIRAVSRHPDQIRTVLGTDDRITPLVGDVLDVASVEAALKGARAAVNAVSLYVEKGAYTFDAVHVKGAANVAQCAWRLGVARLVHISGIGADPDSRSAYILARGRGDEAVRSAHPDAVVLRSAVMFGSDDSLTTTVAGLVRKFPVFPLFGSGSTALQPVWVGDTAESVARLLDLRVAAEVPLEVAGPEVMTYRQLVETIAEAEGVSVHTIPVPFSLWQALARMGGVIPEIPITRYQIELMQRPNVAEGRGSRLHDLDIEATSLMGFLRNRSHVRR